MLTGHFKDARFSPFSNLHTCILLVVVCRCERGFSWRFSPIYIFFLACFRLFRDAPPSRFRCQDLKLCLVDFLKILDLALSQIYRRVFHLWKSIDLDSACVRNSRPYQLSFL